jgi:hypothetical protein
MNYEVEVVIEAFVRFNPDRSFVLQDLVDFDTSLFNSNESFIVAALQGQGIATPSRYDKSRVLQYAVVAPGDFSAALLFGAAAYRRALDVNAIR